MGDVVSSADLGQKIKLLRQQAGLSQEKLAELVGVTFQQIQKYENGQTTLNILKLQHIAKALKVSASDFFSSAPVQSVRLTGEEDQLLHAFRRIKNTELRSCVLKLIGNINKRTK
jgi:transcriptional regulator with XRE-family HTH domain